MFESIELPGYAFLIALFLAIAAGRFIGVYEGVKKSLRAAIEIAIDNYPIANINIHEESNRFVFDDMASGKYITTTNSVEEFFVFLKEKGMYDGKTIILNKGAPVIELDKT